MQGAKLAKAMGRQATLRAGSEHRLRWGSRCVGSQMDTQLPVSSSKDSLTQEQRHTHFHPQSGTVNVLDGTELRLIIPKLAFN